MIDWLVQTSADLPPNVAWLSPPELARLSEFRVAKRRDDWLLGRWTAKRLVQQVFGRNGPPPALPSITIHTAADGAPELVINAEPVACSLSISHSHGQALCAFGSGGTRVGADLELIDARILTFLPDYLTSAEQAALTHAPPEAQAILATAIWSAKEAALKTLRLGLTVDTLRVNCPVPLDPVANHTWVPFAVACDPSLGLDTIPCWWHHADPYVLTLAMITSS